MRLFEVLEAHRYGSVHLCTDERTGLRAVIALHNTKLGPAIGGTRALRYREEEAAVVDAIRLARGMAYKAAISGLAHGGGKAVIMLPERAFDRTALFERFGEFVDSLGGRYVTCEDSGTSTGDMDVIATRTAHVLGTSKGSADPSPFTALGVRRAMEAAVRHKLGRDSLEGLHIAVQGVGHVGYHLVREVAGLGAKVTVADTSPQATDRARAEFGAEVVSTDEILFTQCDILAPCALGAVFNDNTIPKLRTGMVVGASNNVLAESRHGDALRARGILYAPDYVANAGGLINVAIEHSPGGYNRETATAKVMGIYDTVLNIVQRAEREDVSTHIVADRIVDEIIF